MEELTNRERYHTLCAEITTWWGDRVKMGNNLREIQEARLYKEEFDSMESFCMAKFGISRSSVYRLIDTAIVSNGVGHALNDAQAQALKAVPAEVRVEVIEAATSGGATLTAERIHRETEARQAERETHVDKTGYQIPDEVWFDWQRAAETGRDLTRAANELRNAVIQGLGVQDIVFAEITNSTRSDLANAYTALKCIIPYAVCTSCSGRNAARCQLCKGRGYLSRFLWDTAVPEEMKQMRMSDAPALSS